MPKRSPEREQLAKTIERLAEARDRLLKIEAAQADNFEHMAQARRAADNAAEAIEQAKSVAVYQLMMAGADERTPPALRQARAAAQDATDDLAVAEEAEAKLVEMHQQARQSIMYRERDVRDAVSAVVQSDSATAELIARYEAARREVANLAQTMNFISAFMPPSFSRGWDALREYDDLPGAADWQAATAALESNPDAALPS